MYSRVRICLLFVALGSCLSEDIHRAGFCDGSLALVVKSVTHPTSCAAGGSIVVEASGNYGPFTFSLNGNTPTASPTFTGVPPGTYTITVQDANACMTSLGNIVVNTPSVSTLSLVITSVTDDNSCLTNNGAVTLAAGGGVGVKLFSFDGSAFSGQAVYTNLASGIYNARVKDDAGCLVSQSVEIKRANTGTSWLDNVKPILVAKCVSCHPGSGTFDDWSKYTSVFQKKITIQARISAGTMPPAGNTQLTASEKSLINCWIDDGAPQN